MAVIVIITIAILLIVIELTWKNLEETSKKQKIIFIAVGLIVIFIITLIVFNISKSSVTYESVDMENTVKNVLVSLFTVLNALMFLPNLAKIFMQIQDKDIEEKRLKRKIIITAIIFFAIIIFECNYLNSIQQGILNVYNAKINR